MKKTEKISIGGFPFTIEQDAYLTLEQYMKDIARAYSQDAASAEIISAIEERIAELIMEKSGKDAIVDLETVEMVKKRIGDPSELADEEKENVPEGGNAQAQPQPVRQPKRLYRDIDNRIAGGVCSGLAAYFNIDVVITRLLFVLLFVPGIFTFGRFFGIAVLIYLILWIVIPAAKTVEQKCRMTGKPMDLTEFREKGEQSSPIKEIGNEARTSPALKTIGRILCSILGIIMMLIGISGLFTGATCSIIPGLMDRIAAGNYLYGMGIEERAFLIQLMSSCTTWWMVMAIIAIFSIFMIYSGVLLTFNMKGPKWRPGIILVILWFVIVLAFIAHTIRTALLFFA